MRRFIIFVLCVFGFCLPMQAQYEGNGSSVIIRGGYNVLEKGKVYDLTFMQDFIFFRFKLETGVGTFSLSENGEEERYVSYFSPSIGLVYGERSDVYLLFGGSSWGKRLMVDEHWKLTSDAWHLKVEGGVDIGITRTMFLNLEACYFFPHFKEPEDYFNNFCLKAGIGFRF